MYQPSVFQQLPILVEEESCMLRLWSAEILTATIHLTRILDASFLKFTFLAFFEKCLTLRSFA